MRLFFNAKILQFLAVLCCARLLGAEPNIPKSSAVVRAGTATLQRLSHSPASWSVNCILPSHEVFRISVVFDDTRQSWNFSRVADGQTHQICDLIRSEGLWYVREKGHAVKCQPYAGELHFPGAYLFLSLSDLKCAIDSKDLDTAVFKNRQGDRLLYSRPLPAATRQALEKIVEEFKEMTAKDPSILQDKEITQTINQAKEQLANGIPFVIDEKTGVIVETKMQNIAVTVDDFRWLEKAPEKSFESLKSVTWDDQSRPWPEADYENCVMVGHDPVFTPGNGDNLAIDGYVLNLRTEELRRVPYQGFVNMPGCFLRNRREVIVSGLDPGGGFGMLKVNLASGRNEGINVGEFNGSISLMAELSPDGKKIATIHTMGGGAINDMQIQLIALDTAKYQDIGTPGQIGAPFSWLPDGDGLVLKRYKHNDDIRAVEKRIICRLGLDGKMNDLRDGDMPMVFRKSRKILYEDNDSRLWHTCDLDGSHPELFADGLKGYGMPAVSPDEQKILFVRYEKGKRPQLMLFDVGKSAGKPVGHAEGLTSMPIWR